MHPLAIILWGSVVGWTAACINAILNGRLIRSLPAASGAESLPTVSAVVPARNEELGIEAALTSLCTQDYAGFQVVVVDDGSTDGTPAILERLSKRFGNLRVVAGNDPPEGWMGKANAQRVGLEVADGEFILFADADLRFEPGFLRRGMEEVHRRSLDTLVLLSHLEGRGLEPLLLFEFTAICFFATPAYLANFPGHEKFALLAPSSVLVRRKAFEEAGGIARLSAEVVDDRALGMMMKAYSPRYRLVKAFDAVHHRMYNGLRQCIDGFTKYGYHILYRSRLALACVHYVYLAVGLLPLVMLPLGLLLPAFSPYLLPAALALGAEITCNVAAAVWGGQPIWAALAFPARLILWLYVYDRSAWRCRRGKLVWRGRRFNRTAR